MDQATDQLNEQQRKILSEVPGIYRETFAKAFRGESRASALKAFCLACVGYKREDVKACTAPACPLYPYRPFVKADEDR